MKSSVLLAILLVAVPLGTAWNAQYAVDCPERCDSNECKSTLRCKRTVLDDCGCCKVCAAAVGETCYRTVSGMDGVKCGPGLRCNFYTEEDDFGDEYGTCRVSPEACLEDMVCKKGGAGSLWILICIFAFAPLSVSFPPGKGYSA